MEPSHDVEIRNWKRRMQTSVLPFCDTNHLREVQNGNDAERRLRLETKGSKMKKANVEIGNIYIVKVSGKLAKVKLTSVSIYGGWVGTNLTTGREVRIKTAARLRLEVTT